MIKCILFDMDGTIIDDEKWTIISKITEGKKLGYDVKEEDVIKTLGLSKANSGKLLRSIYGEDFPYEILGKYRTQYIVEDIKKNGITLKPYVREILAYCDKHGIKKGICTSSQRNQIEEYAKYGDIYNHFDFLVTGEEVLHGKPSPDIFLKGVEKSGLSKDECLVIEDANSGVEAALNAKIKVLMIPDIAKPSGRSLSKEVTILPSLKEAIAWIDQFNNNCK